MSIGKFFTFLFSIIALIFEGFFGVLPFVYFMIQIILISCTLYLCIWIFRRKTLGIWHQTILKYASAILTTVGFFTSIFLVFIQYQHLAPGVVSDITLSNSGQEIVFVEMSHIAKSEFYLNKQATISALAQSGYTILVEGVKPGTPENQEFFNQSVGFIFTPTLYGEIANFIGLQSQDNAILFAGISTGSLVNVDLSLDEIVALMGTGNIVASGSLLDIGLEIDAAMSMLTPKERIFAGWVARGFLNWALKQSGDSDLLLNSSSQSRFFETIIDRRNDKIIEYIQQHPTEKIAIIYGALHFNGVYESLQKIDPKWETTKVDTSRPYTE